MKNAENYALLGGIHHRERREHIDLGFVGFANFAILSAAGVKKNIFNRRSRRARRLGLCCFFVHRLHRFAQMGMRRICDEPE